MKHFFISLTVVCFISRITECSADGGNSDAPKLSTWRQSCNDCVLPLDFCRDQCESESKCVHCMSSMNKRCGQCAQDIFDRSALTTVNSTEDHTSDYFECSPNSEIDRHACTLYCKKYLFQFGECVVNQIQPIDYCRCYDKCFHKETTTQRTQIATTSQTTDDEFTQIEETTTTATLTTNIKESDVVTDETTVVDQKVTKTTLGQPTKQHTTTHHPVPQVQLDLKGHAGSIYSLISLDNGLIASSSADRKIKVWNTTDGSLVQTLVGHSNTVRALAYLQSSLGKLVSGSFDGKLNIWDEESGQLKRSIKSSKFHVNALAVLTNGDLVSSVSEISNSLQIWDTLRWNLKKSVRLGSSPVYCLVVLDDDHMASGCYGNRVDIWNTHDWSARRHINVRTQVVYALAALNDARLLVTASSNYEINVWRTTDGSLVKTMRERQIYSYFRSLAVLSGGEVIAAGSTDQSVSLWNVTSGTMLKRINLQNGPVNSLIVLPSSPNRFASASTDSKIIKLWSFE